MDAIEFSTVRLVIAVSTSAVAILGVWYVMGGRSWLGNAEDILPRLTVKTRRPARRRPQAKSAVVVGAGIVGLSVARELARRGVAVTLLEREETAGSVCTAKSWAWINANGKQPRSYQELNLKAMSAWNASLPGFVSWVGGLIISTPGASQACPEYVRPTLSPEGVGEVCPAIDLSSAKNLGYDPSMHEVRHFSQEGHVEVGEVITELLRHAESLGVRIVYGAEVTGYPWDVEGDIVGVCYRLAGDDVQHEVRGDVTVLCNGTGVEALAKKAGYVLAMVPRPGLLAHVRLTPGAEGGAKELGKIVVTPWLHMLQRGDGRVVIGETAEKGGASSAAYAAGGGNHDEQGDSNSPIQQQDAVLDVDEMESFGIRMLERAKALAPKLMAGARVERITRGFRPMPADGLPAIGFFEGSSATRPPRLYACVMHSGVTLGPLAGALAAMEIVTGHEAVCLDDFRPGRAGLAKGSGGGGAKVRVTRV